MTISFSISAAIIGAIIGLFMIIVIDLLLMAYRTQREKRSQEMFRKLYDQAIADSFRPTK